MKRLPNEFLDDFFGVFPLVGKNEAMQLSNFLRQMILEKKKRGDKYYLLVTESNRYRDGRIQVYTVDEHNFDAKLGMPPEKKIILRK